MIHKIGPMPFTFPASGGNTQNVVLSQPRNGRILTAIVRAPNFTNPITLGLSLLNGESVVVYAISTLPMNADSVMYVDIPMISSEQYTVRLVASGDPGGSGGTAYVTLYMEE